MRDSRPAGPQQTRVTWLLIAILGLALGLRVWGIGFGLPYEFTNDEGKEIHRRLSWQPGNTIGDSEKGDCTTFSSWSTG